MCVHGSVGVQMISVVSWEWEQTGAVWVEKRRYGNRVPSKREVDGKRRLKDAVRYRISGMCAGRSGGGFRAGCVSLGCGGGKGR